MRYFLLMIVTLLSMSSLTMAEKKPIKLQSSAEFNQRSSLIPAAKNNTLPTPKKSTPTYNVSHQSMPSTTIKNPFPQPVTLSTPASISYQPTNTNRQTSASPEMKNNAGIMLNSNEQPSAATTNSGWMITQ